MWISLSMIQRMPATPARLRAQWRSTESENREAIAVRRQWMKILGCSEKEISEQCDHAVDLNLEDELEELSAAIRLNQMKKEL